MNKRLFILAGLVLLIWLGVYFVPEEKPVKHEDANWPAFTMASTDRIDQESAKHSFSFRKINGEWYAPMPGVADPGLRLDITKVDAMLNYVGSHPPKRRLSSEGGEENKAYGLDKPAASIIFYGESQWKIQVGAKNATNTGVFAESSKESGELLLLDTTYAEQFSRDAGHFYDLRLLPLQPEAVNRIKLDLPDGSGWEITRKDGKTAFTWPAAVTQKKVSRTELDDYLRELAALKGKEFLLPPKTDAKGEPEATLQIWKSGASDPEEIHFYEPAAASGDAQTPPTGTSLIAVSSWQKAPLAMGTGIRSKVFRNAFSLRDKSVLQLSPGQVERQVIRRAAENGQSAVELTAVKSDSGWKADGKERQGLDMLLWRLGDLQYENEPEPQLPQGAQAELTWELYGKDRNLLHTLEFYRTPAASGQKSAQWIAVEGKAPYYPVSGKLAGDLAALLPAAGGRDAAPAADATQGIKATQ